MQKTLLVPRLLSLITFFVLTAAPAFASERTTGTIAAGTPAETAYFVQDSGVAGPTVAIVGGIHGDQPAGVTAAEQIRIWPISRGKIVVIPRANVLAIKQATRTSSEANQDERDLNRNFPKAQDTDSPRGELATAIWKVLEQQKPEWLLDLHEGTDFAQTATGAIGNSLIVFPTDAGKATAEKLMETVNATIDDPDRKFVLRTNPMDTTLARAAGAHLKMNAMLVETTTKSQPLSLRARQHRTIVHGLLAHLNMIDEKVSVNHITDPADTRVKVALYDSGGSSGKGVPRTVELLGNSLEFALVQVGPADIAAGVLDQFRAVIFTGGSGSGQSKALGDAARENVKKFVDNGGGYIGICAGAYLACDGFSWGLKVLDAKTVSPKWARGRATVEMELTDEGRKIFGEFKPRVNVLYHNGPILTPNQSDKLPDYQPLAYFRTEVAENDSPVGVMVNSPAIVAGQAGKGRVMCISPHPEQTEGLEQILPRAAAWVTGK